MSGSNLLDTMTIFDIGVKIKPYTKVWVFVKFPNGNVIRVNYKKIFNITTCYCREKCDILQHVVTDNLITKKDYLKHILSSHGEDIIDYPMFAIQVNDEKWYNDYELKTFIGPSRVIKCCF
jgi:hypothetical protein